MLKTIKIFFVFLILLTPSTFSLEKNCGLYYPQFIAQNSSFDVSIVTSNPFPNADKLELFVLPGDKIELNKAEVRSVFHSYKLNFSSAVLEKSARPSFKTVIDLSGKQISAGTFFQILLNFNSGSNSNSDINFYGIFKAGDRELGYLVNKENQVDEFFSADIHLFKSHRNAGRAVQIGNQSNLNISFQKDIAENLLAEFWIKFTEPDLTFLKISNKKNSAFEFEVAANEFQMLKVNAEEENLFTASSFTGRKSWNHIAINFSRSQNLIEFYSNGKLFAKYNFPDQIKTEDLVFNFLPSQQGKAYQLELLRFIELNNSIETSFRNKNYLTFKADSSKVISQFRFDSQDELLTDKNKVVVTSAGLQYVKSDAPILARAPELNITLLSNSYELEWSGGDYKQAVSYVLERSSENSEYVPVFTIQADNSNEKVYSFLDEINPESEIVYYRIKQINKDGSVVYSSQVKLGQGLMEAFTLGQNYPNPFNPKTSIEIELFEDSDIEVTIYNLEGREIAKLFKGALTKGTHKFTFDGAELPSGIYLYKVATPNFSQTKKMILTK